MTHLEDILKPLEWEYYEDTTTKRYSTSTPFGNLYVEKRYDWHKEKFTDEYIWGYCFDEYYDQQDHWCKSFEDGKEHAWEFWKERVKPILND